MMSKLVRFGILGTSRIAPSAIIEPARKLANCSIVGVASRERERGLEYAKLHSLNRTFTDYQECISDNEVDAVYIGLPNSLNSEWTLKAVGAGKHVLCEKPMALNQSTAQEIVAAAERSGRIVMEGFHHLYHPMNLRLRHLIQSDLHPLRSIHGEFLIGIKDRGFRFDYAFGGGATMDLGCYLVSLINSVSGPIVQVKTAKAFEIESQIDGAMQAEVELQNSAMATINCSMIAPEEERSLRFYAEGNNCEILALNPIAPHWPHRLLFRRNGDLIQERFSRLLTTYDYQLRAFHAAITEGADYISTPAFAAKNMAVIDQIYSTAGMFPRGISRIN